MSAVSHFRWERNSNVKMATNGDVSYFSQANEAFVEENYQDAVDLYTKAIAEDNTKADCFSNRAHAYIKLEDYKAALEDTKCAIALNPDNVKAYLRKGIADFHLGEYQAAKDAFEQGQIKQSSSKGFDAWLEKCNAKLGVDESQLNSEPRSSADGEISPAKTKTSIAMPVDQRKTRYDWYQTATHVVITILLKGVKEQDFSLSLHETSLSATVKLSSESDYSLQLELAHPIVVAQCQTKLLSSKIEIKLKKEEGIHWTKLEGDCSNQIAPASQAAAVATERPAYPSSQPGSRDWDKLVADIKREEKDEKPDGDAALNALFQQIYHDGSDETRKAMNKSFVESGGTVLSTNWSEIGTQHVERKPPDGMEWKKW